MAKITLIGIVIKVFEEKRQNALYKHRFVRIKEKGTSNIFDIQFYNQKIKLIDESGIKEGQKALFVCYLNGKHWINDEGKEGVFLKLNGQEINLMELEPSKPKIQK